MRVEVLGHERRRRWGDEQKLQIVSSVGACGATLTDVAHRHNITRQQIYGWRSKLKQKGLLLPSSAAVFVPVDLTNVQSECDENPHAPPRMIELRLKHERTLCFGAELSAPTLTRLIRAVETA